ncbi:MAG TPA: hypothetical protein VHB77_02170 [Planctomycetaceae bacterium]|nr:hypothetical protein [Planctomycetaceae bacterium]
MDATEPASPRRFTDSRRIDSWGLFVGRCMIAAAVLCFATAVLDAAFHNPARMVQDNIRNAVRTGNGTTLEFAKLAPFAWDDLCIIGPYTPQDRIDALLGFAWENATTRDVGMNDACCLLLFVQDERVVGFTEMRRDECDFSTLAGENGLRVPKVDAVFEVDAAHDRPTVHPRSPRPHVPRAPLYLAVR